MSGRKARLRRQVAEHARQLAEEAAVGRSVADDLRAEGDVEGALEWETWADLTEHGRTIEAGGLRELGILVRGRDRADRMIDDTVRNLRLLGVSWYRIAHQLGVSEATARKRYSRD